MEFKLIVEIPKLFQNISITSGNATLNFIDFCKNNAKYAELSDEYARTKEMHVTFGNMLILTVIPDSDFEIIRYFNGKRGTIYLNDDPSDVYELIIAAFFAIDDYIAERKNKARIWGIFNFHDGAAFVGRIFDERGVVSLASKKIAFILAWLQNFRRFMNEYYGLCAYRTVLEAQRKQIIGAKKE